MKSGDYREGEAKSCLETGLTLRPRAGGALLLPRLRPRRRERSPDHGYGEVVTSVIVPPPSAVPLFQTLAVVIAVFMGQW